MTDSPTAVLASASAQTSLNAGISSLKRKRKPAGTPDPDAEVIALSPQTLMESDRYVCEICNQGFQRDQNLQMHRRRHKVPWKLLKRLDPVAQKRVYICPEPSCLHHHPRHALGDLVGIKKHYRRKHSSMKQWECEKCSKAYAVQSDYKAHMKTCGTRGHCCDCGRVYSRVESFIEHQDTCPSARKKKGSPSTGLEGAAPLSSFAEPAAVAAAAAAAAAVMPTTAALIPGRVVKEQYDHIIHFHPSKTLHSDDDHHHSISPPFTQIRPSLPPSPGAAVAMNPHACSVPSRAPIQLLNTTLSSLISTVNHVAAVSRHTSPGMEAMEHCKPLQDGSMACQHPHSAPQYDDLVFQHHKAELQLLPTSKLHSNQLESSEGSVTLGKEIANSAYICPTSSACVCWSPGSRKVDDKLAHEGGDGLRRPHAQGTAPSPSLDHSPCKLQLSIGVLSDKDACAYSGDQRSMQSLKGVAVANQEENSKSFDSRGVLIMPWLQWSALPGEATQRITDACHDNSMDTPKSYSSLCSTTDARQGIASSIDGLNNGAVDLELAASSYRLHQQVITATQCSSSVFHNLKSEEKLHRFADQSNSTTQSMQYEGAMELLQATKHHPSQQASKISHSSSTRESITHLNASNQQQTDQFASLAGAIKQSTDRVQEVLHYMDQTPSFLLGRNGARTLTDLSPCLDMKAPASDMRAALEALVKEASEKLKRASEEKLEAEKAWIEARREREQAEEERAKVQRIAEYQYRMVALAEDRPERLGAKLGEPTCSSSCTIRSSPSLNSIANCHGLASSFQIMQLQEGSVVCGAPGSLITCPSCHHTSQILYPPPPNRTMGTALFGASPLELAAPTCSTLTTTSNFILPSSPTRLST